MAENEVLKVYIDGINYNIDISSSSVNYNIKTKRFMNGFLPRLGKGSIIGAIGTGVGAALAIPAVLLLGGVSLTTAAIASGVGLVGGTGTFVVSDTLLNGAKGSPKSRFRAIAKGDTDELEAAIQLVNDNAKTSTAYKKVLAENEDEKIQVMPLGKIFSRKKLNKQIKKQESIATDGLVALLREAKSLTETLKSYSGKNLNAHQQAKRESYWVKLEKISECVKTVATTSKDSPYKQIIVEAMLDGVWLSSDVNTMEKINEISTTKNVNKALMLYEKMYESIINKREKVSSKIVVEEDVYQNLQAENVDLTKENTQLKGKVKTITAQNKQQLEQIDKLAQKLDNLQVRYERAIGWATQHRQQSRITRARAEEAEVLTGNLYEELDKVRRQLSILQGVDKRKGSEIKLKDSEISNLKSTLEMLEKEVTKLEAKNNILGKAVKTKTEENEALKYQATQLESANATLGKVANAQIEENEALRYQVDKLEEDNTTLGKVANVNINKFIAAEAEIEGLEQENQELEEELNKSEYERSRLEVDNKRANSTINQLRISMQNLATELNDIKKTKSDNIANMQLGKAKSLLANQLQTIYNHCKIALGEDANTYGLSVFMVLNPTLRIAESFDSLNTIEELDKTRKSLKSLYETTYRSYNWPEYKKPSKQLIPGTAVPVGENDELFNSLRKR